MKGAIQYLHTVSYYLWNALVGIVLVHNIVSHWYFELPTWKDPKSSSRNSIYKGSLYNIPASAFSICVIQKRKTNYVWITHTVPAVLGDSTGITYDLV